jgi:orotate phosphoribosyltransferase
MDREKILRHFKASGALLEGHFVLSSGLHTPLYLQCARVLMDPRRAAVLCRALARNVRRDIKRSIDLVASPAMGGVVVGYEMGRQLKVPAIFFERVSGKFTLRRGFEIPKGANVLMVEDVVTTGLSSRECIDAIKAAGGRAVGGACLVDRSGGKARIGTKLVPLLRMKVPSYRAGALPRELAALPAVKPGSRSLK